MDFILLSYRKEEEMAETLDLMRGFVCGTISGWAQVFVMQPFEIIKVRLVNQSLFNPEYKGIVDCFKRILKEEGVKSFYKGIFPLTYRNPDSSSRIWNPRIPGFRFQRALQRADYLCWPPCPHHHAHEPYFSQRNSDRHGELIGDCNSLTI